MAASPWGAGGRDVVAEFMASCDKAGIAGGVFYSVHENWYRNVSICSNSPHESTLAGKQCKLNQLGVSKTI